VRAENPEEVHIGGANLRKQIENIRLHGVTPVVAINAMPDDFASEHAAIREIAAAMGARCAVCHHFTDGGRGAVELAEAVAETAEEPRDFRFLYPAQAPLREKIETIATRIYGADGVDYSPAAATQLDSYERNGFGWMPVCIAKTQLSLSHDPTLKGAPVGWRLPVREVRASAGAGFIYPICGEMRTMPGLALTCHVAGTSMSWHKAGPRLEADPQRRSRSPWAACLCAMAARLSARQLPGDEAYAMETKAERLRAGRFAHPGRRSLLSWRDQGPAAGRRRDRHQPGRASQNRPGRGHLSPAAGRGGSAVGGG